MFLNNHASTRSILTNNENAPGILRSKTIGGENGTNKKATFNENAVKTPHRNKDAASSKGGGQTTQRRRRALGDISNRKGAKGSGSSGKANVVLKQTQGSLKPNNTKNNRTAQQVKFSKTPSTKSATTNKSRLGGSDSKSANSKPKQRAPSAGYDGVFGRTTRWAHDGMDDHRSPFDLVSEEELNMVDNFRDEMAELRKKKEDERDRLEDERCEQFLAEQIHEDIAETGTLFGSCGVLGEDDGWDLLDQKLPWEEEDEIADSAKDAGERSSFGFDPNDLWGGV